MGEYLRYDQLEVFQLAFGLALEIHEASLVWPKHEQYGGMADQIRRASKGICANMAEGLSKHMSDADERKFLSIALGSTEEVKVWLKFAVKLGYVSQESFLKWVACYDKVGRMVFGLMQRRKELKAA